MWHIEFANTGFNLSNETVSFGITLGELGTINSLLGVLLGKSTFEQMQAEFAQGSPASVQLDLVTREEENPGVFVLRFWRQHPVKNGMTKTEYRMSQADAHDLWETFQGEIESMGEGDEDEDDEV